MYERQFTTDGLETGFLVVFNRRCDRSDGKATTTAAQSLRGTVSFLLAAGTRNIGAYAKTRCYILTRR